MMIRVLFYDKIKNYMMPFDTHKYSGLDYFWRVATSAVICGGLTMVFTYPFDLIHTRTATDMARKNTSRLYTTTFDCFNRTNLDEGRLGLFKGADIAVASAVIRSILQLPVYSMVKR